MASTATAASVSSGSTMLLAFEGRAAAPGCCRLDLGAALLDQARPDCPYGSPITHAAVGQYDNAPDIVAYPRDEARDCRRRLSRRRTR